ncbi:MAG TPA: NAD(P)H-binding protein [Polyangiaceae bacterium]
MADVVVLGCGYTGGTVARLARSEGESVVATVRSEERAAPLRLDGFEVVVADPLDAEAIAAFVDEKTHVIVTFPPDGETDARVAPHFARAAAITYLSSTGVYSGVSGVVDDTTPLPAAPSETARTTLAAEDAWRNVGATVLRSPGIYGADRGLHLRIARGQHRIAGDGSTYTSRIHVRDLAALLLAARKKRGETYVVGDTEPTTQRQISEWVAREYGVAMPPFVPAAEVHESLRADRRVDGSRALRELGVTLEFPSWREGMAKPTL